MGVDEAKAQQFPKQLQKGLKFWAVFPKDAKAEVRLRSNPLRTRCG